MAEMTEREEAKRRIDRIDRKILRLLQSDGRLSNKELAKEVNLSATPCLRRVGMLEQAGIIQGYSALLDAPALGYNIRAFVHITRKRELSREAVWEQILDIPEVVSCHVISGEADLLVEIVARDMDHYGSILLDNINNIEGIYNYKSLFSIKTLKVNGSIPIE